MHERYSIKLYNYKVHMQKIFNSKINSLHVCIIRHLLTKTAYIISGVHAQKIFINKLIFNILILCMHEYVQCFVCFLKKSNICIKMIHYFLIYLCSLRDVLILYTYSVWGLFFKCDYLHVAVVKVLIVIYIGQ